jgi:hypothetical protein
LCFIGYSTDKVPSFLLCTEAVFEKPPAFAKVTTGKQAPEARDTSGMAEAQPALPGRRNEMKAEARRREGNPSDQGYSFPMNVCIATNWKTVFLIELKKP